MLNKSNSMLSLIQSNLIGKVSGSDLSGFFSKVCHLSINLSQAQILLPERANRCAKMK